MKRSALLLALVVTALGTRSAQAYVRSRVEGGSKPKVWGEGCIPVTIYVNGFDKIPPHMSVDAIVKSITAAAHAWSPDAVQCSDGSTTPYLEIVPTLAPLDAKPPAVADDHQNSIIFRTDRWNRSGNPNGKAYPVGALAVTTVTATLDGRIHDADIEINANLGGDSSGWGWANLDPGVPPPIFGSNTQDVDTFDLQTALTHEFGHLLGLDHSCFDAVDGSNVAADGSARPVDDQNRPVPNCQGNPPDYVERAVMFWKTSNLDTSKRVLWDDERSFLCKWYATPVNGSPPACRVDEANAGCAVATTPARRGGARSRTLGLFAVGGLVLAAVTRRARRFSARAKARS